MRTEELIKIIKTYEDGDWWRNFVDEEFDPWGEDDVEEYLKGVGIEFTLEDHYGGEGCGDEYWHVFSVTKDGVKTFFKIDGYYQSHYGHEFHDYFGFYKVSKVPVESYEWRANNDC